MRYFKYLFNLNQISPRIICICFILLMVWIEPCISATYYVDSSNGSDTNSGLTEATAYKSLSKVSSSEFFPGDSILFKRGETWNERLKIPTSGAKGNPITFGAYGSGDKPKFSYYKTLNAWESKGSGVYMTASSYAYGLFEDGNKLAIASTANCTDGNWYYESGTIYYKPTSGEPSGHTVLYSGSYYIIKSDGKSYIDFQDLELSYAGGGIHVENASHVNVLNCNLHHFYHMAIEFRNTKGNCSAINNVITKVGNGVYLTEFPAGEYLIAHNTISYCNYEEYDHRDGHGIGIQNTSNSVFEYNNISYCRMGPVAIWTKTGKASNNNIVRYNRISNSKKTYAKAWYGQGIAIGPDADYGANGNEIYYNIIEKCNFGIKIKRRALPGNKVYNNVIYDCTDGYMLSNGTDNNLFKNNIIMHSDDHIIYSAHSDVGNNNIFAHNCYYPDLLNGFVHKSTVLGSFQEWQTVTGEDANSFVSDPLFVDTDLFKLGSISYCINAGVDVQLCQDIQGIAAPQGNGVDIGANEFSPFSILPPAGLKVLQIISGT